MSSTASVAEAQRDVDAPARRECLSALVSASRPMRSRWCSCDASRRCGRPFDAHVGLRRRAERHLPRHVGQRAGEVAALERLRSQVHDRAPRLFQAVAQHLPRDVERLPRRLRRRLQASRDGLELERDAGQALLERVVQLAADPAALVEDGLVLLPLAFAVVRDPERRAAGNEREHRRP